LRWRAPRDPEPWTATRPAKSFAQACVQCGSVIGPGRNNTYDATVLETIDRVVGSEDCLYLNIWRPASTEAGLPVIVFIHGGYDLAGFTADPMYDGAHLARFANAVVVTVGYRLGVFGWFSLPQLRTGDPDDDSGNFGTLDNVHALRWVRDNIAAFGGEPGNVTLMGQSAGAVNALLLLVARPTRDAGLFHKIVAISGGMSLAADLPPGSIPMLQPAAYHAAQGLALLGKLFVADGLAADDAAAAALAAARSREQIADYLRSKTPAAILTTVLAKLAPLGLGGSCPIPDGSVLPVDPVAAVAAGSYARVPVLAGNTRDEGRSLAQLLALAPALGGVSGYRISDAERFRIGLEFDPDAPSTLTVESLISPQYLPVDAPVSGYKARTAVLTAIFMFANRDSVLNALKVHQANVWHYQFDWARQAPPYNETMGAGHLVDLPFLFGNFGPALLSNAIGGQANRGGRLALSEAMMGSLAAFARSGDPNHAALGVRWPVWPASLLFDAGPAQASISVR
jgi:para-nitrobenzyl esterase